MADDLLRVEVDPAQFRELMAQIKEFDPQLATALRRRLRAIGKDIAAEVQQEIRKPPPSGGRSPGSHRSREQIASGIGVKIMTGKKKQGMALTGSSKSLPAGRKPFARLYNKDRFRHPVFMGRKRVTRWVYQEGRPYFGRVIKRFEERAREDILAALQEAADTIRGA